MQFVRAPDENVYIAPLNLVEIIISGSLEWWMKKQTYELINDWVMGFFYSPLLFVAAYFETRTAHSIRRNRARGEEDDDVIEEWEQLAHELDFEADGWAKTCNSVKPNLEDDPAVVEVRKLRAEVEELKSMLAEIGRAVGAKPAQKESQSENGPDEQTENQKGSESETQGSEAEAQDDSGPSKGSDN